ncbi:MreB/Mrl family cell shape determining protein [Planococcaceae bacterium Storch 2/2-2]|nr:MreB/Mrl family cell shape determining protein [Planococcaceae bacterium Storch 2/2-2]
MFSSDIGIDLGTANLLIHTVEGGVIVDEPAVVAIDKRTKEVLAVGDEAYQMVGRTPGHIVAVRPLQDGVISDFDMTEAMLSHFLKKVNVKGFFAKPRILICCPANITMVEQKAIYQAAAQSGGKNVFLEEEPKVAAVGAGMNIFEPKGNMIIDIGGGTTDVAVLSLGGVVTAESVRVAGNGLDEAIIRYVKKEYNLLIGERTAERVKREIGTVLPSLKNESMSIRGRDLVTGLPKTIDINSEEVASAFEESVQEIVQTAKNVLEKTPPELSADVIDHGIFLTGGGALLHGLDELLSGELQVPVFIAEDPLNCVAIGTTRLLQRMK